MHLPPPPNMKKMPPLTTADIAFLLCTSQQQPGAYPRRTHPVTLQTDYGLLIRLLPDGSVSAGLANPPIPQPQPLRIPAPAPAPVPPLPSSIDEILHTPLTPSPGFSLLDPPPPSSFFSQPRPQTQTQPQPQPQQPKPSGPPPPPPPPPPAQQFKYLLAPSLHDPGASYLWYVGGWPGNPAPPAPPRQLPPAPPSNAPRPRHRRERTAAPPPPPHPVPEDALATRYHPSWFNGYLDWAERLEASGSFVHMDEGERVLWTVEGLLLACWLSLQADVAGVEYWPEGAQAVDGRVYEVRGGDLGSVLDGLFGRGGAGASRTPSTHAAAR